jgi:hypothetical protein
LVGKSAVINESVDFTKLPSLSITSFMLTIRRQVRSEGAIKFDCAFAAIRVASLPKA